MFFKFYTTETKYMIVEIRFNFSKYSEFIKNLEVEDSFCIINVEEIIDPFIIIQFKNILEKITDNSLENSDRYLCKSKMFDKLFNYFVFSDEFYEFLEIPEEVALTNLLQKIIGNLRGPVDRPHGIIPNN
jgi:hypothetical protein